jgi:hypothetical protein
MLMGIAMQDKEGRWFRLKKIQIDTIAKTLSGNINHFSDWSRFEAFKLNPVSARLKVNKTLSLSLSSTVPIPQGSDDELSDLDDGSLMPLVKPKYAALQKWSVNGIQNGNSSVGTTRTTENYSEVIYKAPANVPNQNPVAVEAHLTGVDITINGKKINDLRLVSNILIYDNAYEVNMIASIVSGGVETWGGLTKYKDKGSFIVSMDKGKPEIIDIQNNLETLENNCDKTIFNPETCTGIIHISGVKGMRVIPANPPSNPYPIIEIIFVQKPVEYTKFKSDCPPPPGADSRSRDDGIKQSAMATLLDVRTPGFPVHIKFAAKPGEQVIYQKGSLTDELYVQFTVRQIKDD